ncbi:hypothetical protein [Streptomyces flavalbus]|uniref:Peptidoglycan binding domain-containing protein n=1 Tax=Streptomyces flavalbus TaxID=2665155 RepID=A0ABW2WEE4_9ACTN
MSRETDSPSSGPNGRGAAAYPSGTPPYGTPTGPGGTTDAGRTAAQPEDRKTETTLTTRIRINIPGSRPIPPVVVRKPVGETEDAGTAEGETPTTSGAAPAAAQRANEPRANGAPGGPGGAGGTGGPGGSGASGSGPDTSGAGAEEKTSDWFAPRKSPAPKAGAGGAAANGSAPSGASPAPGAPGTAAPRPGGAVGSGTAPGAPRPGGTNGAGLPGATGGPVAPGHGGGTGSFDVTEALTAGQRGTAPRRDDLPYFTDDDPSSSTGQHAVDPYDFSSPGAAPQHPTGPTGGPVTGDGPRVPAAGGPGAAPGAPGGPAGPGAPGRPGMSGGGPHTAPGGPGAPGHPGPGGGLSDDTAILTPQKPAPEPPGGLYGSAADNVSGHTVTSGIPVVPPADRGTPPFGTGAPAEGPRPPAPPRTQQSSAPAAAAPRKKGRNKLVLLGGGVLFIAGLAYGAGLLMNHSDVPKGTTVLGVDIGGGTRDEAVKKLDGALGDRIDNPLKLSVGGESVALKPDQAGLQFDATATVAAAAASDYNPVSVIGSLFGNQRVVEPVMPVDEEKLQAALETAAGGTGSVTEGTIKFVSGKAVPVYGKEGKGIAVDPAAKAVAAAYRTQVETGEAAPVQVPTTAKRPTVDKAEVDRMMKEFAEPAMSGNVTVQTDAAHSIAFSPENSLWKFLGVKAVDGKLVESYDKAALKELYGSTFDGVQITRATGDKTPVTVEDVIGALRLALKSTTDRTAVIETNPN